MRGSYLKTEEHRIKIRNALLGKPLSKERREKISKSHLGKKLTEQHKKNISKALKGRMPKNLALLHSPEMQRKATEAFRGCTVREKHWNWKGGYVRPPYTIDWTKTLRRSIRERDNYTCQICNKTQGDITYCIHHIDYNPKNCSPTNLITLCRSCHQKTNFNRSYWQNYLQNIIQKYDYRI